MSKWLGGDHGLRLGGDCDVGLKASTNTVCASTISLAVLLRRLSLVLARDANTKD